MGKATNQGLNWAEFTTVELNCLRKIFNEEIKKLKRQYNPANIKKLYPHRRILDNDLEEIMGEFAHNIGHSVQDEMNIRLGRSQKSPSGDMVPSEKAMARMVREYEREAKREQKRLAKQAGK